MKDKIITIKPVNEQSQISGAHILYGLSESGRVYTLSYSKGAGKDEWQLLVKSPDTER